MSDKSLEAVPAPRATLKATGRPPEPSQEPLLLSTEAARRRLSCGKTKLFELIRDRELEAVQIGSRRLIVAASVEQFVERLRQLAR